MMLRAPEPPARSYTSPITDSGRWQAFEPRAGDIVVCTPPKCGTTWTQGILALLISGDPETDAETSMKSPWIDINVRDVAEVMQRLAAQLHRRQVKTHTPLDGVPYWPDLRYITVYRHPLDMYLSLRKHAHNHTGARGTGLYPETYFEPDPAAGFMDFLKRSDGGESDFEQMIDHYDQTLARRDRENLIMMHYADMLADLPAAFGQICAHVGISHPPELMARLIDAATFDSMKANAHRFAPSAGQGFWQSDAGFFNSGGTAKWQGVLSEAHLAAYDGAMSARLSEADRQWLERGSGKAGG